MIPAGIELFSLDATLFGVLFFEHVQGKAAKGGKIFGSITDSSAALIFAEADVHHPVQFVFYAPVATHGASEKLPVEREQPLWAPEHREAEELELGQSLRPKSF